MIYLVTTAVSYIVLLLLSRLANSIQYQIEHCLLEWQSGVHQGKPFTINGSWATYAAHKATLEGVRDDADNGGQQAYEFALSTLYNDAS